MLNTKTNPRNDIVVAECARFDVQLQKENGPPIDTENRKFTYYSEF